MNLNLKNIFAKSASFLCTWYLLYVSSLLLEILHFWWIHTLALFKLNWLPLRFLHIKINLCYILDVTAVGGITVAQWCVILYHWDTSVYVSSLNKYYSSLFDNLISWNENPKNMINTDFIHVHGQFHSGWKNSPPFEGLISNTVCCLTSLLEDWCSVYCLCSADRLVSSVGVSLIKGLEV